METEHGSACLNKFLKHWTIAALLDTAMGVILFAYDYDPNIFEKHPGRFQHLYNVRVKFK